jgi:hypothetical protein
MKQYAWSVVLLLLTGGTASANPFDVAGNFKKIDQSETVLLKELDTLTIEKGVPKALPKKRSVSPKKKEKSAAVPAAGVAKEKHPSAATPEVQEAVKIETAEERMKRVHTANIKEKALAAKQQGSKKQEAKKRADAPVKRTPHQKVESKKILSATLVKKPHKKIEPSVKSEKKKTLAKHERGKTKLFVAPPKKEILSKGMEQELAEAIREVDQE